MTSWRIWRTRLIIIFAVLGPGFITANVDNDAGGILTYSQAGAQFGYTLLWTMIPITIALIVVQEMCARMGVVTGKGLSDLIREEFGLRITFVIMILLVAVNFTNVVTEFSGIAGSMQLFHVSKYASVPICAVIVWALVVKGDDAHLAAFIGPDGAAREASSHSRWAASRSPASARASASRQRDRAPS